VYSTYGELLKWGSAGTSIVIKILKSRSYVKLN
jgi:hypothetical protein